MVFIILLISKKDFIYVFLEVGEERKKEGEKHLCERETSISCLFYAPWLGIEPTAQACALIGNQTRDLLVARITSNQLSHTGQGKL